jgi:hypothetical protein
MNHSANIQDWLEGEQLACNGDQEYDLPCLYVGYMLGPLYLSLGLWFAFSTIGEITKLRGDARVAATQSCGMGSGQNKKRQRIASNAFTLKLKLNHALHLLSAGALFTVNMGPAMYDSSHPRGFAADVLVGGAHLTTIMLHVLQRQGAAWFDAFLNVNRATKASTHRASLGVEFGRLVVLGLRMLGDCALGINAIVWVLLLCGVVTRTQYYNVQAGIQLFAGIHTIHTMITKRAVVLAKVAAMQKQSNMRDQATQRRDKALAHKMQALVLDIITISVFSVVFPAAFFVFSVYSSSRTYIVAFSGCGTIAVVSNLAFAVARRRRELRTKGSSSRNLTAVKQCGTSATDESMLSKFDGGRSVVSSVLVGLTRPAMEPAPAGD